jgi:hypothetical protein
MFDDHFRKDAVELGNTIDLPFAAAALFSNTLPRGIVWFIQIRQALADCFWIHAEQVGNVLRSAIPQLIGLDRRVPSAMLLGQRSIQALHPSFHLRAVVFHGKTRMGMQPHSIHSP